MKLVYWDRKVFPPVVVFLFANNYLTFFVCFRQETKPIENWKTKRLENAYVSASSPRMLISSSASFGIEGDIGGC